MKFSVVVAIVADELEDDAVRLAKEVGAGGVTTLNARGLGLKEKKTFMGLTYERNESVLIFVLEKKLSLKVIKNISTGLELDKGGHGLVFSLPIEHLSGINLSQLVKFEENVKSTF